MNDSPKRIVVVGGGFGGIRAALDLFKKNLGNAKIMLITDRTHFEYYPSLYRIVTGKSPLEVCVPLDEIFKGRNVEIMQDRIVGVDKDMKSVKGESGSVYSFDYLVLALGSETAFFNVPGLAELAFGFKSINEALKLKRHLHDLFPPVPANPAELNKDEAVSNLHLLVVGGGPTGVEVAGELVSYMRALAVNHKIDSSFVTVDLIEAAPRLLPAMPEDVSRRVYRRLHDLGVNIFLNRAVMKEDIEEVYLKDMTLKSKTVIWTAGTKPHHLYAEIKGFQYQKNGKVIVDDYLQPTGMKDVFVIGDAAATKYSGLAQTAIYDGAYVANFIAARISGKHAELYKPKKVSYAMPIGPNWAAVVVGGIHFYGRVAWWLRRIVNLKFFLSILPLKKALTAFQGGKKLCESCETCLAETS